MHQLDHLLPEAFPSPQLVARDRRQFEHLGRDGWSGYWPPEDSAVAPDLVWTAAHEQLVLAAYRSAWSRFLEPDQTYEIVWPPVGYLWSEGEVLIVDLCVGHGEPDCADCDQFEEVTQEIIPAHWVWSATIQTLTHHGSSVILDDSEAYSFLTTLMDPRDVDYAP